MQRKVVFVLLSLTLLSGCSNSSEEFVFTSSGAPAPARIVFEPFHDPSTGQAVAAQEVSAQGVASSYLDSLKGVDRIPTPTDLLRDPVTGQNALPAPTDRRAVALKNAVAGMNQLSGFSTGGRITIPLTHPVDLTTVTPQTMLVLAQPGGSSASVAPDYQEDTDGARSLRLTPIFPLQTDTEYLVVLTEGVRDSTGRPYASGEILALTKSPAPIINPDGSSRVPNLTDKQAQDLEQIRQRMQPVWAAAEQATGKERALIPLAFSFRTQKLFATLQGVRDNVHASTVIPTITESYTTQAEIDNYYQNTLNVFHDVVIDPTTGDMVSGPSGVVADHQNVGAIYVGTIPAPWYIDDDTEGPSFVLDAQGQLTVFETRPLQFLAILPKATSANQSFPVTIFQHGLSRTKADMADMANTACGLGRAMIGVDLPLHGANVIPGEPSGFDFYNALQPTLLRDNVRQSVANLFVLNRLVSSGNAVLGGHPLLGGRTSYVGHSEGAFIGGTFAPLESDNEAAVLAGGSAQLMISIQANYCRFGKLFDEFLQLAGGVKPGTANYREYYFIAQTLMDDADSFNNLAHSRDGSLRDGAAGAVLLQDMFEVINPPPLVLVAESQPQARALGGPQVSPLQVWSGLQAAAAPFSGSGEYQYRGGGHNWVLEPSEGPDDGAATQSSRDQLFHFIDTAHAGSAEIIDVYRGPDVPLGQ